MKTWALTLTVLLAVLLSPAPPVAADHCCPPAPCCPAGECQCHMSAPGPTQPADKTSATLPAVTVALVPTPPACLIEIIPVATLHRTCATQAVPIPAAPLYALTHSYLI